MTAKGEARLLVEQFQADLKSIHDEIGKTIVGHIGIVQGVVTAILSGGHVLLEGVPGLGKTLLVRTVAESLSLQWSRIQFTPDLMPSDVTGTNMITEDGAGRRFEFQRGPIFAHVLLADEINRATPKTQSALLEAMQEGVVTVGRTTHPLPSPFIVLATQNPIEMEGTYPLPEAQLDRFFFKLLVLPPSRAELHAILDRTTGAEREKPRAALAADRLVALRAVVREVPVAPIVQDFVVRIVEGTHPQTSTIPGIRTFVKHGASPRGAQAIVLASKVQALRDGRFSPSFDDVRTVAAPALRHRILLNFEAEIEGVSTDDLIADLIKNLPEG